MRQRSTEISFRLEVVVAHRRGVVDNGSESIVAMCELLGTSWLAKMATIYRSSSPDLEPYIVESPWPMIYMERTCGGVGL